MPGSFFSSSIRRAMGSANLLIASASQPRNTQPAQHAADGRFHGFIYLASGVVDRGSNEILQHLDVFAFNRFRIDGHAQQALLAVHLDLHAAATGRTLHHGGLHFVLQILRLFFRLRDYVLYLRGIESCHQNSCRCSALLIAIVNHGADFGAEFFLYATDNGIIGSTLASGTARPIALGRHGPCAFIAPVAAGTLYPQAQRPAGYPAGSRSRDASRLRPIAISNNVAAACAFTTSSEPSMLHSASCSMEAKCRCPPFSSAANTRWRAARAASSASLRSLTATAPLVSGCAADISGPPLFRARSCSNGEACARRGSSAATGLGAAATGLAGAVRAAAEAGALRASMPLRICSTGSNRCACTNLSSASSRWNR